MKKIKFHYQVEIEYYMFRGNMVIFRDYKYLRNSCHKRFSTLNEAKQAFGNKEDEYRRLYKIRGKRTRGGLPNPWDDYPSYCYDLAKCWKHNSKRKNQWYREKNEEESN